MGPRILQRELCKSSMNDIDTHSLTESLPTIKRWLISLHLNCKVCLHREKGGLLFEIMEILFLLRVCQQKKESTLNVGGDTNMLRHTGHYNLKVFIA